jgi:hypothetical protein
MSFYFLVNNLHFAFGMIGAIILIMATWLVFDSYMVKKSSTVLMRFIGILLFSVWQILYSLDIKSDVLLYFGYTLLIIGLAFIVISFLRTKQLSFSAVIVIPAFTLHVQQLSIISTILFFTIAYLAIRQWKREYDKALAPFAIAFLLFGVTYFLNIFHNGINHTSFLYILSNLITLAGTVSLGVWVWQYMRLRIHESIVMLLVGIIFILSTIVTLAFSTILINKVIVDTSNNLISDVKVLDFSLSGMKEEALVKAQLVALDTGIIKAIEKNDFSTLNQLSGELLEKYNLGFLIIADKDGSVLVRGHALSKRGDSLTGERAYEEALLKNSMVTTEDSSAEGFSIRAGAPIYDKNNMLIGVAIAGFPLDNAFADSMKRLKGFDMFIYKGDTSVAGTALSTDGRTRLVGNIIDNPDIKSSVLSNGISFTGSIDIFGTQFQASYLPLLNGDDKIVGMISVAKQQQDIVNVANATNRLTLTTVLLILLVLIFPIYFMSKKIAKDI